MNEWKGHGMIRIADEVVAVIARIATLETEGIVGMSGGIAEGIAKRVSGKSVQKGVQVTIDEDRAYIDLRVSVSFGQRIDRICKEAQRNVKDMVENMTGIEVQVVNVRVESVDVSQAKQSSVKLEAVYL
ncbi:Asp23/Gls24 family envelope stress response protein [Bacillus horti]|uniref:Alkaline shock family protein YloU n=1 Tax=Caldalkalibacillus horti TaxID=77523 RepID=A0ABT9W453_9BACI|nr:Asp23/Gls24 family envelope stress response protein [Bacillus horti]MDQ0167854.1 putative alkaline shock family protein YloU [Bacillus horti]